MLRTLTGLLILAAAASPAFPASSPGGQNSTPAHEWNLGPTGAHGRIATTKGTTRDARGIEISRVDAGSPAAGLLEPGDLLLGIGASPFTGDARVALGEAITEAETKEGAGRLRLLRRRGDKTKTVTIKLPVLGRYAATAPWSCEKSERIRLAAIRHLQATPLRDDTVGLISAMALLANESASDRDRIKEHARKIGRPDRSLPIELGMQAWSWGLEGIYLAEYHLATGDRAVLPAIRALARAMAEGQSAVGTWGHGMSLPGNGGRLSGYGAVNQAGLGCWLAMILAQRCGVRDPEVERAVERSRRFFAYYAGKGSIPYGDHSPWIESHDNNGKNALAAQAFDLLGDEASFAFFARMSTASFAEREAGHTGNYFGYLWGPLGVARLGAAAAAAHLAEQRWYYDLARRWDGGFEYQGLADDDSYHGWDMTGVYLMTLALPKRALELTGKGIAAPRLADGTLAATIADGRLPPDAKEDEGLEAGVDEEALLAGLSSWSPVVRWRSAKTLAKVSADLTPVLILLLRGTNPEGVLGACEALEKRGARSAGAVDALIDTLDAKDAWLVSRAAFALAAIGDPARKAAPKLLALAAADDPDDPRQTLRKHLCLALFVDGYAENAPHRGLLARSLEGIDRELFDRAFTRMLQVDDGLARSFLRSAFKRLSDEDLGRLMPRIVDAVREPPLSGEMFENEIRLAGLELLARRGVEEGIDIAVDYARRQNPWGSEERMEKIMAALTSYGERARRSLPALRRLAEDCRVEKDFPEHCRKRKTAAVEAAIRKLETPKAPSQPGAGG